MSIENNTFFKQSTHVVLTLDTSSVASILLPVFFKNVIYVFVFGCARSSLLHVGFLCCGEQGILSSWSAEASHCSGFSCCRAQALEFVDSVAAACRL